MQWVTKILPDGKWERDNLLKGVIAGTLAVLIVLALKVVAGL